MAMETKSYLIDEANWRNTHFTERERLMLAIICALVLLILGLFLFDEGYVTNVYTEVISFVATVVALGSWQARRERDNLKKQLVRNAGKRSNAVVLDAIDDLRHYGWLDFLQGAHLSGANLQFANLSDGNLNGADLSGANLHGVNLNDARLQGANLASADLSKAKLRGADLKGVELEEGNLQGADLWGSNLQGANLRECNLREADLWGANLQSVKLWGANLQDADLTNANLQDAYLRRANLQGANLIGASLENATMPNGEKWVENMDIGQFTDSDHPNFYVSIWYRQNDD